MRLAHLTSWYRRLSVPQKIRLILALTATAALFVAMSLLSIVEVIGYRQQVVNNISTLAQVTAVNATAATEFQDPAAAHTLVSSLSSDPSIDYAHIFSSSGALLASHIARTDRAEPGTLTLTTLQSEHGHAFDGPMLDNKATRTAFHIDHLDAVAPIRLDGEVIGYVHIQANLTRLYETLVLYAWTAIIIMAAALSVAYAVTARMRDSLSTPLLNLVEVMNHVSAHQDYQVRASKTGDDEIGALVDGFNGMLEQIQERDRRLAEHRRYLENQIAERTAHLERALDDARQATKAKGEFLARMSHEIRTPMNGVLGMTELLRNSALDVRQRRLVDTVYKSGQSLLQIINDILDFSKAEAGRLQLAHVDFSLRDAVEDACELLSERADAKQLELICAIANDVPAWINGDPLRLKQVLLNLIGNAIKFTEHGNVVVRVVLAEPMRLRFEVTDNGPGIAREDQQRLFEPFTQADAFTTRTHGGTGLGLAIARELVTLMHGYIGIQSQPGHGATFWFELPFAAATEPSIIRLPRMSLAGSRAIVVDDNAISREILVQYLSGWGIAVATAEDGERALAQIVKAAREQCPYDVVVLDHQMPNMDGIACLQQLRSRSSTADTRVVLLSSMGLTLRTPDINALRIDEALTKPVRQARLYAALIRVLGKDANMQTMQMRALTINEHPNQLGNVRVLLVEDNDVNREVALGMLTSLGCEIRIANDGQQAVEAYTFDSFDIVLMDCHMPTMDGYSAAVAIRAFEAQSNRPRTPILAVTANVMEDGRDRCIAAGMDDFLVKPFNMNQLRTHLEQWTKKTVAAPKPLEAVSSISRTEASPDSLRETTLDTRAITSIQALRSPDLVARIIGLYEARAPKLIESGQIAILNDDTQALANAAHELKSSSANLGGERLARLCKECEAAARRNDTTQAHARWQEARAEFERFRDALRQLRSNERHVVNS